MTILNIVTIKTNTKINRFVPGGEVTLEVAAEACPGLDMLGSGAGMAGIEGNVGIGGRAIPGGSDTPRK